MRSAHLRPVERLRPRRSGHSGILAVITGAALAVGTVAGCSGSESTRPSGSAVVASATAPSRPSGVIDLEGGQDLVQGIEVPWGLAFLPEGGVLVAERDSGAILRVRAGVPAERVYQVPGVAAAGEGGLLGLAVSPQYRENGYVYAYFTAAADNRIVRFRLGGQPEVLFSGIAKASNHNGGRIAFGPDGMLYVGTGDAGSRTASQDPASPNGKILRLTSEGRPAPGNPTPAHRCTPSATAMCKGWTGIRRAACSPPSSARTASTRSTASNPATITAGRRWRASPTPAPADSPTPCSPGPPPTPHPRVSPSPRTPCTWRPYAANDSGRSRFTPTAPSVTRPHSSPRGSAACARSRSPRTAHCG